MCFQEPNGQKYVEGRGFASNFIGKFAALPRPLRRNILSK